MLGHYGLENYKQVISDYKSREVEHIEMHFSSITLQVCRFHLSGPVFSINIKWH